MKDSHGSGGSPFLGVDEVVLSSENAAVELARCYYLRTIYKAME